LLFLIFGGEIVMADKLTVKQEKYTQGLFAGLSQREAYREAFPSSINWKDETVDARACELAKNSKVVVRLEELTNELKQRNMVTIEKTLAEYAKLGFSDVTDYLEVVTERILVDRDRETNEPISEIRQMVLLKDTANIPKDKLAAISEIKQAKDGSISFKLHDKRGALDSIGKHLGMFADRHEVTGKDGGPITIEFKGELDEWSR
jgi:phage terminase small subunit